MKVNMPSNTTKLVRYALEIAEQHPDNTHESPPGEPDPGFDFSNPLGVSVVYCWLVVFYMPLIVVVGGGLGCFSLWVLSSTFLRYLVIQPMLNLFIQVQIVLMLVGPFYVWLGHTFGMFLSRNQVFPCFLLLWAHNFAMIASSGLLVAMIIERTMSIGRSEVLWDMWRMACRNISVLMVVTSFVLAVSGLLCIDVTALTAPTKFYPICMPWWDNEIGTDVTWFKIVAGLFSVAPGAAIFVSLFVLAYRVNKFKSLIRTGVGALNHYTALYIEIKANQHLKFVRTVFWLGTLFIIASSPVGMFIIIGPYIQAMGDYVEVKHHAQANLTDRKPPPRGSGPPSYYTSTYMSISRSDLEVTIWLIYYTFAICVVPVLLYTEILFYREWSGRMRKLANFLCCRKPQAVRWPNIDVLENDENASKLAGPYIACSDGGADETLGRLKTSNEAKLTKIFDAGNAIRAGRDIKQMLPRYSRQVVGSELARQAHVASMFGSTTPGCKTPKEPAVPKRENAKNASNKSHARPHVVKSADSSTT